MATSLWAGYLFTKTVTTQDYHNLVRKITRKEGQSEKEDPRSLGESLRILPLYNF